MPSRGADPHPTPTASGKLALAPAMTTLENSDTANNVLLT